MTAAAGAGYTLLALGPAAALFVTVIAHKPVLVITVLSSALIWLVSLICISAFWRAFLPASTDPWLYAFILVSAVGAQEAVRLLFWRLYGRLLRALDDLAVKLSKPKLLLTDNIQIALAAGLGHGVAHVLFFCLSLLVPAFGPATFYSDACPRMPLFLVTALTSLGFLLIHTFSMIIAFTGYSDGTKALQLFPPGMHMLAALLTLVNTSSQGCMVGVPLILSCAAVTLLFCWKILWDKTGEDAYARASIMDRVPVTGL